MNADRSYLLVSRPLAKPHGEAVPDGRAGILARSAVALVAMLVGQSALAVTLAAVTRDVAYTYDPNTGQLLTEQVDPGLDHCVETDYTLDNFGSRKQVLVKPCGSTSAAASFIPRVTVNEYQASNDPANLAPPAAGFSYPAGAYLTHSSDGTLTATLSESRGAYDPRFGSASLEVAVARQDTTRNLTKRTEFDNLGRVVREYVPAKRRADNSIAENYVQYKYVSCYPAATTGCYSFSVAQVVTYDSRRLVDAWGTPTPVATVWFTSSYFVESTSYDVTGAQIGATSRVHYDALDREIAKEAQAYDGSWTRTLTGYDQLGMQALSYGPHTGRDASGNAVAPPEEMKEWIVERDLMQRPIEQHRHWRPADGADGSSTASELVAKFSFNGLETKSIVPASSTPEGADRVSYVRKSPLGAVAQTVNADGATLNKAYDPVGNLTATLDPLGFRQTTAYTPGTGRFKVSMTDPDMGHWFYDYDALGQLVTQHDGRGVVTQLSYDARGRLIGKSSANFVSKWYYDQNPDGSYCAFGLTRLCYSQLGASTPVDSQRLEYDSLGRPFRSTSTLDTAYVTETSFDDVGRPLTLKYPTGLTLKYAYSTSGSGVTPGALQQVFDNAAPTRVFWRIDTVAANQVFDARGNLKKAVLGNGLTLDNRFDSISGKVFSINAGRGGSTTNVFSQAYTWDKSGNLSTRADGFTAVSDAFAYDLLDRLTSDAITSTSDLTASRTTTVGYNAIGNILVKSDVGGYTYSATDKPHAVRAAGNTNYNYDADGNISSSSGYQYRVNTWNDFNQPDSLSSSGNRVDFSYDADYKRVKEVYSQGGTTRTVYLVHPDNMGGLAFEREETRVGGALTRNESRHYITVGGNVIAVVKTLDGSGVVSADPTLTNYWHRDSLGSIVAVSNATNGDVLERMAFDAWGRRISIAGKIDPNLNPANGNRGFTGHEEMDEVALVHMNGRVYDPMLGRFISSDSVIEATDSLQSYNRYSYVLNNPLKYTDPSGHCIWDYCVAEIAMLIAGYELTQHGNSNWRMVGTMMMVYAGGELCEAGLGNSVTMGNNLSAFTPNAFNSGFAGNAFVSSFGASLLASNGNFGAAVQSGMFAAMGATVMTAAMPGTWQHYASNALIKCAQAASSGGSCGPAAAISVVNDGTVQLQDGRDPVSVMLMQTVSGGTTSVIGGGKFSNGAYKAGFKYVAGGAVSAFDRNGLMGLVDYAGKIWAFPNTAVGLAAGFAGVPFGATYGGYQPEYNAFVFTNYPVGGSAITFGNTILSTTAKLDVDWPTYRAAETKGTDTVILGRHESGHTYQYQVFGVFFLPVYIMVHPFSSKSPFEAGADTYGQTGKGWWAW